MPSRIIASSLARNCAERAPACKRGSLKTPVSRRLYHSTNPSRSHVRIFNLSPLRERKMKRLSPKGSWPITARTRSAKRSKPQRMSVASAASQMRGPCAPSNACKLGSPIITRSQAQPAVLASDPPRIRAQPIDSGPCSDESQSPCYTQVQAKPVLRLSSLSLLRTSPLRFLQAASSIRKKANPANLDPDRTPLLSDRSDSALKPVRATSPAISPDVFSFHKIETSRWRKQDGVKIPLTIELRPDVRSKRGEIV